METYTLPILSPQHNTIHLALFHDVTNVETILSSLRTGAPHADLSSSSSKPLSSDTLSQYAFLDASVIVSRQHVFNAVLQALTSMEPGYNMKTRSWNTEVMWVLWPGHNVSLMKWNRDPKQLMLTPPTPLSARIDLRIPTPNWTRPKDVISRRRTNLVVRSSRVFRRCYPSGDELRSGSVGRARTRSVRRGGGGDQQWTGRL